MLKEKMKRESKREEEEMLKISPLSKKSIENVTSLKLSLLLSSVVVKICAKRDVLDATKMRAFILHHEHHHIHHIHQF